MKDQNNIRKRLLAIERLTKTPVIVTLLIDNGRIKFISCQSKNVYSESNANAYDDYEVEEFDNFNYKKIKKPKANLIKVPYCL